MEKEPVVLTVEQAVKPDYEKEIISIIKGNYSPKIMLGKLEDYHASDIADVIEQLTLQDRKKLFRVANVTMLAEIFEHLEEETAGEYLIQMDFQKASALISELETDTAVGVLQAIDKEKRDIIVEYLSPDIKKEIRLIASFEEDEIGSKMTTNFIVIRENLTVKEAMSELIRQAETNDNISTLFVVDETESFYGAIVLKDLIIARRETPLENLIATSFPYVYATETVDDCIERLKDYSEDSIPVLDNSNKLLGVITSQSIIEVVDDEMGEDYAKFAGLTAEEDLTESLGESVKKRLPWLLILLCLGMGVSAVVGVFEGVVSQLTIIMAFQSLILDMAGNVGTQSLAVTIRVLMDETLSGKQKTALVFKEIKVGFTNGVLLGLLSFVIVGLYIALFKDKGFVFAYAISGCIGISLLVAMVVSSAVGTMIPLLFKKMDVDPAVASGPLITTINDLVAVVVYYGMSWLLLLNIMNFSN